MKGWRNESVFSMKAWSRRFLWLLPAAVALAIMLLSHRPTLPLDVSLPPPLDKMAHFTAFAVLAATLEWALRSTSHRLPVYRRHLLIFILVSLFGALDEWHQSFVPGRECDVFDWLADTLGGAFGLAMMSLPFLWSRRLEGFGWWRGTQRRPDAARPLILVADAHWGSQLTGLEEATKAHPEADWLFLGDVFDVWIGLAHMQSEAQREFLAWAEARRSAGCWVGVWMGNREYFLDGLHSSFSLLGEGVSGALPDEGLAWEHGDLLNDRDLQYRFWCLVSRSGPLWLLFRLLPGRWARALASGIERRLRTTNEAYKIQFPAEAFQKAAASHGQAIFLTGHFHTHHVHGNGVALPWAHGGAFMVWRQGRVEALSQPSGT